MKTDLTISLSAAQSLTLISTVSNMIEYCEPDQIEILNEILVKLTGSDHPQIASIRHYALFESNDLVY